MWILTKSFAIMPSLRYPRDIAEGDDRVIQVRARRRVDLERFRDGYCPTLGEIITDAGTDYDVRAYCTHEALALALAEVALDINYQSFKSQTIKQHDDHKLHTAYMRVWSALYSTMSTRKAFSKAPAWQSSTWRPTTQVMRKRTWEHTETEWRRIEELSDHERELFDRENRDRTALERLYTEREPDVHELAAAEDDLDAYLRTLDVDDDAPVRHTNGTIDHSFCSHGAGKAARRRCHRRWNKTKK